MSLGIWCIMGWGSFPCLQISFAPLMHAFVTIMARWEANGPRDLWNNHCSMFITHICNPFRRNHDLLRNEKDALVWPFRSLGLSLQHDHCSIFNVGATEPTWEFNSRETYSGQDIDSESIHDEVQSSISTFSTEQQQHFSNAIVGPALPVVTSSHAIDTLPSTSSRAFQSRLPIHHTPTFLLLSSLIFSRSPFCPTCLSPAHLFVLDASGEICKMPITKAIK